ncbi:MAG: DNA-methyltransferase [Armatimonadota bacterium]
MIDLRLGDNLHILPTLPEHSIDAVVTDPPYELGFMGKKWDATGIAYNPEMWSQVLRVLKPGGHLLSFGGSRTYHRMACAIEDAGFDVRDQIMWIYGSGFPKSHNLHEEWDGWGTALKPAHELLCLARKPFPGTVEANVARWGTGAVNVDGCRIGTESPAPRNAPQKIIRGGRFHSAAEAEKEMSHYNPTSGRWPANVIHDGSEEVLAEFAKAGERKAGGGNTGHEPSGCHSKVYENPRSRVASASHADSGTAARFFYCAKASPSERGEANHHPTVKPLALMRYLVRLITPPGGTVLDPFAGSGSTGIACVQEGFSFIGIEREAEYLEIARRRIEHAQQSSV